VICTIATTSYLGQVRCLLNSFLRHHPEGHAYVLELQKVGAGRGLEHPAVTSIAAEELEIPEFHWMLSRYDTFEMCNALKPFLMQYVLAHSDHRKICYLDADVFIFGSLTEEVWDELDSCSLLLTPHLCQVPGEDRGLVWRDLAILRRGTYNGGFVGLRRCPEAEEFLRWWGSRVLQCGYNRLEEGMNCDQRWLDLVPGFELHTRVSRRPGLNAAFWNLHERRFELVQGRYLVNGEPLKFFHFSGYSPERPEIITSHNTPFTFENRPDVRLIFDEYLRQMRNALRDESLVSGQESADPLAAAVSEAVSVQQQGTGFGDGPRPNSHPRVSVVIPVFNAGLHIGQAVESVLHQTLKDVEIIVVDDGSTVDMRAILLPYGDRIRFISQPNAGVSAARNRGIEVARGELIAFLDADDTFLLPTKLEEQVACFDSRPDACIVHSGWRVIDEDGRTVVEKEPWKHAPLLDLRSWLLWQPALPSAMMFRRDALMDAGGFDARLSQLEDVDLMLRLALEGHTTCWLEKITVAYRRHGENASLRMREQAEALETMTTRFFARADLPADIRRLERDVRYSTLVWMACQLHRAGFYEEMAQRLLQSLGHSSCSPGATFLDWIERFRFTYSEDFGSTLSVFELTELNQWQQLVRSQLIGRRSEGGFLPAFGRNANGIWGLSTEPGLIDGPPRTSPQTVARDRSAQDGDHLWRAESAASYEPKINLTGALERNFGRHRSGWTFALQCLKGLHHERGVLVDAFVEHTFDSSGTKPVVAHRRPWVGFIHNPPNMPEWFVYAQSPQSLLASREFRESLDYCLGLFCLSDYHRQWLERHLDVSIVNLIFPTEMCATTFSMESFLANQDKKIVQVGSWLRKLHSIYYLPVTRLKKAIVYQHVPYIDDLFTTEKREFGLDPDYGSVEVLKFLSDAQYDHLLARNIVYLELYDSSANNTIIECLVRNTPVLVNPLPSVKEYLGEEYPFYFVNRGQAARKAEDASLIEETHRYLQNHPMKRKLTAEYFAKSVAESEIYRSLAID
jgi:GT2 family glycosyltransferase